MRGAPIFYAVPHVKGAIDATLDPARPVTKLHSELKRDWRIIIDGEADPARVSLLEPSPQGLRLSDAGLQLLIKGEGPFTPGAIVSATEAVRTELDRQRQASAAALAAAGGPKQTTPKAPPTKKKAKRK